MVNVLGAILSYELIHEASSKHLWQQESVTRMYVHGHCWLDVFVNWN